MKVARVEEYSQLRAAVECHILARRCVYVDGMLIKKWHAYRLFDGDHVEFRTESGKSWGYMFNIDKSFKLAHMHDKSRRPAPSKISVDLIRRIEERVGKIPAGTLSSTDDSKSGEKIGARKGKEEFR